MIIERSGPRDKTQEHTASCSARGLLHLHVNVNISIIARCVGSILTSDSDTFRCLALGDGLPRSFTLKPRKQTQTSTKILLQLCYALENIPPKTRSNTSEVTLPPKRVASPVMSWRRRRLLIPSPIAPTHRSETALSDRWRAKAGGRMRTARGSASPFARTLVPRWSALTLPSTSRVFPCTRTVRA